MSDLGFNSGYIEELYARFLDDPNSVSESWREFFADYAPSSATVVQESEPVPVTTAKQTVPAVSRGDGAPTAAPVPQDADIRPMRGASARIVENMEASLGIPTATSVRTFSVKLLVENRTLINDHQKNVGGVKVSYTQLIAHALVQALKKYPTMYSAFRWDNSTPQHISPSQINLGLAIDVERKGRRSLMVPNIKGADSMSFAQLLANYNEVVRRSQTNRLTVSDFQDTTVTLTNPGMIGTNLSVPRLMPRQGLIVGVGSIGYPPIYQAVEPSAVSKIGLSPVITITSTYDHRVIQGAESGAFLRYVEQLLRGEHDFYAGVFADLNIQYPPFAFEHDSTPQMGSYRAGDRELSMVEKQARVMMLIRVYRELGHLQADTNPLGYTWKYHEELDPAHYGLTVWDLDREFVTGGLAGQDALPLRKILTTLRETYTHRIGASYMHITSPIEKQWLQQRIEANHSAAQLSLDDKRRILHKLNSAEAFERFLHTRYVGHKRFSLEGGESVVPMLDAIIGDAAEQDVQEVVIGMAHRGRLNILANIMGKSYESIFTEFEGSINPDTIYGSGDVKYHLGTEGTYSGRNGATVELSLASNPSHLESVSPIVEGMVRAKQDLLRRTGQEHGPSGDIHDAVIPILIHGDAAFAGQGVVAETLNCSQLRGYHTGGTIHIVINNQIGFTTVSSEARSSTYATDVARLIEAPIFHVNADYPEACVNVARLALDYRQVFNKDVVIDMLCYRQHGHNEGDEPMYTNPLLYQQIKQKRSPRKLYTELLLRTGAMSPEEAEAILDDFRGQLQTAFQRTSNLKQKDLDEVLERFHARQYESLPDVDTRPKKEDLENVLKALLTFPEGFAIHKKLLQQFTRRDDRLRAEGRIDWAFAEALAFGTLLVEGVTVRLSGQDSRRATFSQRHAVIYDQNTGEEFIPLNNITDDQEMLFIYDSLLSEYAVCAFEYGYSVANPHALVMWEAQFGDFSNGAQIVFDQFLSAAEEKWGQTCSMVTLLPHGYEGQGPEHSSARLERYLQLCAEGNMIVCNMSTPANYFHALRRQVIREAKKPLVLMTPKSLLRHPKAISRPEELLDGQFMPVLPSTTTDPTRITRVILTSGKVYYDLLAALEKDKKKEAAVALVRIEQYYPFPWKELKREMRRYSSHCEVYWVQEEPANMGAWTYIRPLIGSVAREVFGRSVEIEYVGRTPSASPATGSAMVHKREQDDIILEALLM